MHEEVFIENDLAYHHHNSLYLIELNCSFVMIFLKRRKYDFECTRAGIGNGVLKKSLGDFYDPLRVVCWLGRWCSYYSRN